MRPKTAAFQWVWIVVDAHRVLWNAPKTWGEKSLFAIPPDASFTVSFFVIYYRYGKNTVWQNRSNG
jgi:hypothetical protein